MGKKRQQKLINLKTYIVKTKSSQCSCHQKVSLVCTFVQTSTTNHCKFLCFTVFLMTAADENEFRLIRDVMSRYDKRIRPSVNHTLPTTINFSVALAQIIDVVKFYLMYKLHPKKRTFPPIFVILFLHCLFQLNTFVIIQNNKCKLYIILKINLVVKYLNFCIRLSSFTGLISILH